MDNTLDPRDPQESQESQEPPRNHPHGWDTRRIHEQDLKAAEGMFTAGMLGNDDEGQRAYRFLRWLIVNAQAAVEFSAQSRYGRINYRGRWLPVEAFTALANEDGQGDSELRRWLFPG